MKTLYWDMINPFTGTPFTWDDPNLRWGDPSYYLEPGDPGFVPYPNQLPNTAPQPSKKPFRRKPKAKQQTPTTTPTTNQNTNMSTFKFNIIPKAGGGFRTQAVLGEQIDETALTAAIAAAATVTPAQAETVIKTFLAKIREAASGSGWAKELYGEFGFRPTCGGSKPSPDAFQNADEINADIALTFTSDAIADWKSGLTLESQGTKGFVTPIIATILCEENGAENHYVAGTMVRLIGTDLRFDKTDVTQGVFFIKADNTEVRATVYGPLNPSEVTVLVPAALTGTLRVRIAAFINGSIRSYTYSGSLT
jgi:hypothetical protein